MVGELSHVKQLSLNHVCKIGFMATWMYIYWDKASGHRIETQSLPTLYPAAHPFHPIPHSLFRPHAKYVYSIVIYI